MQWKVILPALAALWLVVCMSCRTVQKEPLAAVPERKYPRFQDDLQLQGLREAAELQLRWFESGAKGGLSDSSPPGFDPGRMKETLEILLSYMDKNPGAGDLDDFVRRNFDVYRAAGSDGAGNVLFTGYYVPVLEGSREATPEYRFPLYRRPADLVKVNLGLFREKFQGIRLRGRVKEDELVPYYDRREIDKENILKGTGTAFLWVKDYLDLFFLHIQGSGRIRLPSGERINVGFEDQNGRPYVSIGRVLVDDGKIPKEEMSAPSIKRYLRGHPDEMESYLFRNGSYVFFEELPEGRFPLGSLNLPLTAGRSLAADETVFPKGGLVFIESEKPVVDNAGNILKWEKFSRFMLDQDRGGAIRGPGRMDIFFGEGSYAETAAGYCRQQGRAYYLLKKKRGEK